ncbi:MAG: hypothetical protein JST17_15555 [Bacteroidetes bacterium]|nr:hypothetical protein [Bacteroidota bacterium]
MKPLFLFASITLANGLLFTNIYNSMIDATSWGLIFLNLLKQQGNTLKQ